MESTTLLLALGSLFLVLLIPGMLYPTALLRWLQRKRYQYEVTFSLYMMTPTEKFILNSFLFLTLSMILIAAALYLPEHVVTISHRAFYYYSGSSEGPSLPPSSVAAASLVASATTAVAAGDL